MCIRSNVEPTASTPSDGVLKFPQQYLAEAASFLQQEPTGTSVGAIKGIWVASDEAEMINEVHALAGTYFPGVLSEDIVFVDGGVPGGVKTSNMTTHSHQQVSINGALETIIANNPNMSPTLGRLLRRHSCSA